MKPAPSTSWRDSVMASTRTGIRITRCRSVVVRVCFEEVGELAPGRLPPGGHVLAGRAVGGRVVAAQDVARNGLAVHLVGAVVDPRGSREAVHLLERHVR